MIETLLLLAALQTPAHAEPPRITLTPVLLQNAVLFLSDHVTAGGAGGGAGVQLLYRENYLAQLDLSMLWMLGNTVASRLALGVQRDAQWAPAAWGTFGLLWGNRVEILTGDGRRPAIPSWSVGIRGSLLRFSGELGTISVLEPGIATDFGGGLWLELTVLQAGARF